MPERTPGNGQVSLRTLVFVALIGSAAVARASTWSPVAAGVAVSGTVSGSDQGFLTGASVVIDGATRHSASTDADGRFAFTGVAKGRYRIAVSADGYLSIERPLDVGDAPVSMDVVLLRLPGLE
jgi:hypothetical protein